MDPAVGTDEASDVDLARLLCERAKPAPVKLTTPKKVANAQGVAALGVDEDGGNEARASI